MRGEFDVPLDTVHPHLIMAACPVCGVRVPFAEVSVEFGGWMRPRARLVVAGDGTDFAAHMWSHREENWV